MYVSVIISQGKACVCNLIVWFISFKFILVAIVFLLHLFFLKVKLKAYTVISWVFEQKNSSCFGTGSFYTQTLGQCS